MIGRKRPKGFKVKSGPCKVMLVRGRLKAACRDTGSLSLQEAGPVGVLLTLGDPCEFCVECGGTAAGKSTRPSKRKACPAPATCG